MSHTTEGDLHAWLDGALQAIDEEGARRLTAHLARCADCRARLEGERAVRDRANELLGAALPAVDVPPFETVVTAPSAPRRWLSGERMGWAAAVVVALGAGWMGNALLRGGGDSPLPSGSSPAAIAVADAGAPQRTAEAAREGLPPAELESADIVGGELDAAAKAAAPSAEPAADEPGARGDAAGARARDADAGGAIESGADRAAGPPPAAAPPAVAPAARTEQTFADRQSALGENLAVAAAGPDDEVAWRPVDEDEAAGRLGRRPLRIEGLEVVAVEVGDLGGRAAVRVVQRLPGGETVRVIQETAPDVRAQTTPSANEESAVAPLSVWRNLIDGIRVFVVAPLASDSLAVLVSRIR